MSSFILRPLLLAGFAIALVSCAGSGTGPIALPSGAAAYETIPVKAMDELVAQRIRPGDKLSIRVFGEPELTSDEYVVDASGFLQVPLAGQILAGGQSPDAIRLELVRRLGERFIRDPQVSVAVAERAKSQFAVEGQVNEPGVYEADTSTTLLAALARAKSPNKTAKLDEILVFRTIDGRRMGARFDLNDIRSGRAEDPQIIGGDTVVVGYSSAKGIWQDFLASAPLFNLFYVFR
jgi:polysaccharide export outer membrane protein